MKNIILSIMLLLFPAIAFPYELPIYDNAEFKKETYFHEKYGENYTRTVFTPTNEMKQSSSLRFASANIIKCPEKVSTSFSEEMSKSITFKNLRDYEPIHIDKCIDHKIRGTQIYIVQINIEIKLANTSNSPAVRPIVWLGINNGNSIITEFFHVSDSRFFESRRSVSLRAISDINNDGQHEIILEDERYAGSSYIIFEYQNGKLNSREVSGDSWD